MKALSIAWLSFILPAVSQAAYFGALSKIASTELESGITGLTKRATDEYSCLGDLSNSTFYYIEYFNGIFLEGFVTGTGHYISGPLYVSNQWIAQGYTVNRKFTGVCTSTSSVDDIGLIIRSSTNTGEYVSIFVNGNVYVPPLSILNIAQESGGCQTIQNGNYGPLPFDTLKSSLLAIQNAILGLPTTLVLNSSGNVVTLPAHATARYDKFQFGPCLYQTCTGTNSQDSDAQIIFFRNWPGPNNFYPYENVIIFNIPVWSNSAIYLNTVGVSSQLDPCQTIFHFYPVSGSHSDPAGAQFDPNGLITIIRDSTDTLAGVVFAPQAVIYDGDAGNFAGKVIGQSYKWVNPGGGTNILAFEDLGDSCSQGMYCSSETLSSEETSTSTVVVTTTVTEQNVIQSTTTVHDIDTISVTSTIDAIFSSVVGTDTTTTTSVTKTITDRTESIDTLTEREISLDSTVVTTSTSTSTRTVTLTGMTTAIYTSTLTDTLVVYTTDVDIESEEYSERSTSTDYHYIFTNHVSVVTELSTAYQKNQLTVTVTEYLSASSESSEESSTLVGSSSESSEEPSGSSSTSESSSSESSSSSISSSLESSSSSELSLSESSSSSELSSSSISSSSESLSSSESSSSEPSNSSESHSSSSSSEALESSSSSMLHIGSSSHRSESSDCTTTETTSKPIPTHDEENCDDESHHHHKYHKWEDKEEWEDDEEQWEDDEEDYWKN